ncbi:MAG: low-specificity L-threonine aldolase [Deltaproteobacteria bacterium]|nr:low-specificity L-threonine aldolase [Deltaproteobacteria bacterium]
MKHIDLRSDTVTRPDQGMRAAMARAEVGDDVLGDDPTVNRLQEMAANLTGKDSALFVPSGTMGNQLAIMTHTNRGNEVICGRPCHIQEHEVGAAAILSAVTLVTIDAPLGTMDPVRFEQSIREKDIHHPETGLLCLECAHSSGAVQDPDDLSDLVNIAHGHGLPVHMDGARIFNAAIHLGLDVIDIASLADSVMFCVSKGLGAPVGSLLCGDSDFIESARKNRKILGGGMRQAGVLAAAGIYALEHNVESLAEDHEKAKILATALAKVPGLDVSEDRLDINMVWFSLDSTVDPYRIVEHLAKEGLLVLPPMAGMWRLVVHRDIDEESLANAIDIMANVLSDAATP